MSSPRWTDKKLDTIIGNLLGTGVLISALIVFCGGIIFLTYHGRSYPNYRVFQAEPPSLRSIPAILRYAFQLHGAGIIQLGLLMLIATPVARVVFSIFGFTAERDRMYVIFTLIVLAILLFSLFGSSSIA